MESSRALIWFHDSVFRSEINLFCLFRLLRVSSVRNCHLSAAHGMFEITATVALRLFYFINLSALVKAGRFLKRTVLTVSLCFLKVMGENGPHFL